jgi:hypothetical protein
MLCAAIVTVNVMFVPGHCSDDREGEMVWACKFMYNGVNAVNNMRECCIKCVSNKFNNFKTDTYGTTRKTSF